MKNIGLQRHNRNTVFLTAGWLFADLLLVLSVIFLISGSKKTPVVLPNAQTPAFTSQTEIVNRLTPTSTRFQYTPTPEYGLNPMPSTFYIYIDNMSGFLGGDTISTNDFLKGVKKNLGNANNLKAGLIITQGYHKEISLGLQLANKANELLIENFPNEFGGKYLIAKSYWYGSNQKFPSGTIKLEIYFYTSK
jgi:hypothetical protein